MAFGLGSRLNGCIQSYTGITTKITNISTTNTSTTTTTTTEATTSHGWRQFGRQLSPHPDAGTLAVGEIARLISLRKNCLRLVLRMSKVALGLFDILLQFAPDTRSARVGFVGSLFEEFKFASRPTKA
jgi:hypothetical protein